MVNAKHVEGWYNRAEGLYRGDIGLRGVVAWLIVILVATLLIFWLV